MLLLWWKKQTLPCGKGDLKELVQVKQSCGAGLWSSSVSSVVWENSTSVWNRVWLDLERILVQVNQNANHAGQAVGE
jgi:hypothetical protein